MSKITFNQWMGQLDDLVGSNYGMSIYDLPDMNFRDSYDDGESPQDFFENNVGDMDDLEFLILG